MPIVLVGLTEDWQTKSCTLNVFKFDTIAYNVNLLFVSNFLKIELIGSIIAIS